MLLAQTSRTELNVGLSSPLVGERRIYFTTFKNPVAREVELRFFHLRINLSRLTRITRQEGVTDNDTGKVPDEAG